MTLKKIFQYKIILLFLFTIVSCEDYLDREPVTTITTANFYNTQEDAEKAVNAVYVHLKELWRRTMWYIGDLPGEDALHGGGGPSDRADATEFAEFTIIPTNGEGVYECWDKAFSGISKANSVLAEIPKMDIDQDLIDRFVAESKTLKAYYYFILLRCFGDVPLFKETPDPNDFRSITRAPQEDVYEYIIQLLNEAASDLPDSYPTEDLGRVTRGTALTILADIYLTTGDYQKCIDACNSVENIGVYSLEEDYSDLYNYAQNENGKESIFEVQYRYQPEWWEDNTLISEYTTPHMAEGLLASWGYSWFPPSVEFLNLWDANDQRFKVTLLTPGDTLPTNSEKTPFIVLDSNEVWDYHDKTINPTASYCRKYINLSYGAGEGGQESGSTNMYIYRFSEILLIRAEAAYRQNPADPQIVNDLDRILNRAYRNEPPYTASTLSGEELLDEIFIQRRKEFYLEQKRWFDIKRLGKDKAKELLNAAGKINFNPDVHWFMPIPQDEIDLAPGLEQNPGY